jgi:hypothetical protein
LKRIPTHMPNPEGAVQEILLYRIRVLYPANWWVQCNPVLRPEHGSFDLFEPSPRREAAVTVLWRPAGNLGADGDRQGEEANNPLWEHRRQVIASLGRSFKELRVSASLDLTWCGHVALEDRMTATYKRGILKKKIRLARRQRILLCTETGRIVSVYGSCLEEQMDRWGHTFASVFDSLHCHHR